MKLSKNWQSIAVQQFRYSEQPPLYYQSILCAKKVDGVIKLRRVIQRPPVTDLKMNLKLMKATAKRLKIPYVVGVKNNQTSITLSGIDGRTEENVIR